MTGQFSRNSILRTPGLPNLEALGGDVNRQRPLSANPDVRRTALARAQFHEQRKLLERAVKLSTDELVHGHCVHGHVFTDTGPLDDQVQLLSADLPGWHFVNDTGASQAFAIGLKPFFGVPVLRKQMFPQGLAILGQIKVSIIAGLQVCITHAEQVNQADLRP